MRGLRSRDAALLLVIGLVLAGCSDPSTEAGADAARGDGALPARTVEVGGVTVTATPSQPSADRLSVELVLDTHSGALDQPLPQSATLTVGGTPWPAEAWKGDGPGGHHREGTLTFRSAGPAAEEIRLALTGLPGPAELTWP